MVLPIKTIKNKSRVSDLRMNALSVLRGRGDWGWKGVCTSSFPETAAGNRSQGGGGGASLQGRQSISLAVLFMVCRYNVHCHIVTLPYCHHIIVSINWTCHTPERNLENLSVLET